MTTKNISSPRGAAYLRRSRDGQEESPTFQLDFAKRKAAELGLELEGSHEDVQELIRQRGGRIKDIFLDEDISGNELDRPGLSLLREVFENRFCPYSALITFRRDRLARPDDPVDGLRLERTIHNAGATLVFNDKTVAPAANRNERIASDLMAMLDYNASREELDGTSQRTLNAQISVAKRGAWTGGRAPYGFARVFVDPNGNVVEFLADGHVCKRKGHFVSIAVGDPVKIALRVRILDMRLANMGFKSIAATLNREGIPSPDAGRKRRDSGVLHEVSGRWHHTTVKNFCQDKIMLGLIEFGHYSEGKFHRFGGKDRDIRAADASDFNEFTGKAKRIINPESMRVVAEAVADPQYDPGKFAEVQKITNSRSNSQKGTRRSKDPAKYPLSCRVVDLTDGCGQLMHGTTFPKQVDKQTTRHRGYCCSAYMQHGRQSGCHNNRIDGEKLLDVVVDRLRATVNRTGLAERIQELVNQKLTARPTDQSAMRREALERQLAEIEEKIDRVVDNMAVEKDEELKSRMRKKWDQYKGDRQEVSDTLDRLKAAAEQATASPDDISDRVRLVLEDLKLTTQSPEARRRLSSAFEALDIWVGLDFEEAIMGTKRRVRRLKHGIICVGRHHLPTEVHGSRCREKGTKKDLSGESEDSSTKVHRDDRIRTCDLYVPNFEML